jgi:hypothetical protein
MMVFGKNDQPILTRRQLSRLPGEQLLNLLSHKYQLLSVVAITRLVDREYNASLKREIELLQTIIKRKQGFRGALNQKKSHPSADRRDH